MDVPDLRVEHLTVAIRGERPLTVVHDVSVEIPGGRAILRLAGASDKE